MPINFECCYECVAPKRYPGCHDSCPEYNELKAKHDKRKEEYYGKPGVKYGIHQQKLDGINRAIKRKKVR